MGKAKVIIRKERCKGCGLCVKFCPHNVLALSKYINSKGIFPAEVVNGEKCVGCGFCYLVCPDIAIEIQG